MALCTAAEIKAFATEFSGVLDATVNIYIAQAEEQIAEDVWGSRAKTACMWLTCHLMIMGGAKASTGGGGGGAAGGVTSVRVGDVSVNYGDMASAVSAGLDPSLAGSKYGVEYARLQLLAAAGAALALAD